MMNNQFSSANLASHTHSLQMPQHVVGNATSQAQNPNAVLNTIYNAQHQQQHQLAAAVAAAGNNLYSTDTRQLQLTTTPLDKTYYTTTVGSAPRFYTATSAGTHVGAGNMASNSSHPNTILITNNFTHQQTPHSQSPPETQRLSSLNPSNIRIVSTTGNPGGFINTAGAYQHGQHVFNLGTAKTLPQIYPQHVVQQPHPNFHGAGDMMSQPLATQHYSVGPNSTTTSAALQIPQYYVASPEATVAQLAHGNAKVIGAGAPDSLNDNSDGSSPASLNMGVVAPNTACPNGQSTVVLDRINICINNLYTDTSSSSASNSMNSTPAQQPSPIIPTIQHKAIIDNGLPADLTHAEDSYEPGVLVIDEPDSTTTATTPHTPPTTPENSPPSVSTHCSANNNITTTTSSISSPSTSSNLVNIVLEKSSKDLNTIAQKKAGKPSFASTATYNADTAGALLFQKTSVSQSNITPPHASPSSLPLTPPSPPSPMSTEHAKSTHANVSASVSNQTARSLTPDIAAAPLFTNGEDVFIKRQDGRFYLGTVIACPEVGERFLVRFDDKTEQWCKSDEMRKLGGGSSTSSSVTATNSTTVQQPMCVACKQSQPELKVEICERCGRGYHLKCTRETSVGSRIWLCKRCQKPMKLNVTIKVDLTSDDECETVTTRVTRPLPYDVNSLTWDAKHRENLEQTYCYCGKSGKYDRNMFQCRRCLNWFHTYCTDKFKGQLLRCDFFFIFICSFCNEGQEYLRRLQPEWPDVVHLLIYNLSMLKRNQNIKHFHLMKDIYPFACESRSRLPLTAEWQHAAENEFLDKIQATLRANSDRFLCGRDIKRDHFTFAMRTADPPVPTKIVLKPEDIVTDDFVANILNLAVLPNAHEKPDLSFCKASCDNVYVTPSTKDKSNDDSSHDVYVFDDTSEDEIPIKLILDKAKRGRGDDLKEPSTAKNRLRLEGMDVDDDNANDMVITTKSADQDLPSKLPAESAMSKSTKSVTTLNVDVNVNDENAAEVSQEKAVAGTESKRREKSSRKRKAFTATKSYEVQRVFDSSSDENSSSSSRGTSLDLIIPPPKNFLGQNNPFRVVTPKKNGDKSSPSHGNAGQAMGHKKSVTFGIFNTSGLNFSSKLAALKSAGLFPKLSTSNLAKAAGQPRTVRTIKRRLSAKDITIGPNQEVRRRRTRRLSANIEVISTTTINPLPTNFFPIHAKDLLAAAAASTTTAASLFTAHSTKTSTASSSSPTFTTSCNIAATSSNRESGSNVLDTNIANTEIETAKSSAPSHGRRLRQRPPKMSPNTSRRSSVSSNQSSSSTSNTAAAGQQQISSSEQTQQSHEDLKQTVNKYFGIVNRIESGEQFSIRAKRLLANGQMQYLIEWGDNASQQQLQETIKSPLDNKMDN